AGEIFRQRRAVAFAKPTEGQACDVRTTTPGWLIFGTKCDCQQDGQLPHAIDCQIKQLARSWINPVSILQHHQNRPLPRVCFELAQKGVEQCLEFALWAEIEISGRTRQRKHFAKKGEILISRAWREQRPKFVELAFDGVVAGESGGAFEMDNKWMKGSVL